MSRAPEDNRDSPSLSLMRAASDGDVPAVRSLLAAGADVNATNQGGQTALMLAALMGNRELVARLLEAGADLALRDRLGLTALEWSTRRGFSEVSQLLIKASPTTHRPPPRATSASASTDNEAKSRPTVSRDLDTHPSKEVFNISPAKSDEAVDEGRAFPDQAKIEERSISSERPVEPPSVVTNSTPFEPKALAVETDSQQPAVASAPPPPPIAEQPKTEAPSTPAPTPGETESKRFPVASAPPPPPIAEQPTAEAPSTPAPTPVETESKRFTVASAPPPPPIAEQPKAEAPSTPTPTPVEAESRPVASAPQGSPNTEQPLDVDKILGAAAVPPSQTSATELSSPTGHQSSGEQIVQSEEDEEETLTRPRVATPPPEITRPKAASAPPEATRVSEPAQRPRERVAAFDSSPLGLSTRASSNESEDISNLKRCPKCDTTYRNTHLLYCTRDYATLISIDATTKIVAEKPLSPSFTAPLSDSAASQSSTPVAVWLLIAFVLGASAFGAYRLTEYFSRTETPGPVAAKPAEAPVEVKKPFFSVGGALAGMELNVPEPEYPAEVQSAGVTGPITIRVRVNRNGRVISASAASGDQRLRTAAIRAARQATFAADKLAQVSPRSRIISGSITYEFPPQAGTTTSSATAPVNGASPGAESGTSSTAETGGSTAPTNLDPNSPLVDATLAGAAVNIPGAEYPARAKSAGTGGTIIVTIRVNRAGKVVSWRSSTGDSQLRAAAIKAARKATFDRDKLPGNGEVVGTITYNFTP